MHVLLARYKEKLSHLPFNDLEKSRLGVEFERQLLRKLLDAFYSKLTDDEKARLDEAPTTEKLMTEYLTLLSQKIDYPDFIDYLDNTYMDILTFSLNELPEL